MTGLAVGRYANENHKQLAQAIFKSVGEVIFLDEKLFNALTALSASGPAYLYVVIESLAEAGVKLGMARETATFIGRSDHAWYSAKMLLANWETSGVVKRRGDNTCRLHY